MLQTLVSGKFAAIEFLFHALRNAKFSLFLDFP